MGAATDPGSPVPTAARAMWGEAVVPSPSPVEDQACAHNWHPVQLSVGSRQWGQGEQHCPNGPGGRAPLICGFVGKETSLRD